MQKALRDAVGKAVEGNSWKKFTNPSAGRGKTAFPNGQAEQERVGVRWDYDGEVSKSDGVYHKFQMQPNAGKVPSPIKKWRDANGGTHATMASALVKQDGTKADVEKGLDEAAKFYTSRSADKQPMNLASELFDYTSGRWMYNDQLRHSERRRFFDVSEFKRLAAESINQHADDVTHFEKMAEGGFNRTFLIRMRDGFEFIGRVPYLATEPRSLVVANEVATMDFLREQGLPIPEIYSYSTTSSNAAHTEYIFMELVRGTNLGDIWFQLNEKSINILIDQIVELERKLSSLQFPASGSLYYVKDLPPKLSSVRVSSTGASREDRFCIGPDTRLELWYGKRKSLNVDRGPYRDPISATVAGAKKEITYLTTYGQPILPLQRQRRETHEYKRQSHLEHLNNLEKFLQIAPYLLPESPRDLLSPKIKHPDLQPHNIFISDKFEITGMIDWQHCTILPHFLQIGIPNSIQNYGDVISESRKIPQLPSNFDEMSEAEQLAEFDLLRKRQLHHFYLASTARLNPARYASLTDAVHTLRRKLFHHASGPWEGDNVTLKADLILWARNWPKMRTVGSPTPECPIAFSEAEEHTCLQVNVAYAEADKVLKDCEDLIGVGPEGWVPLEHFVEAKRREQALKSDTLDATTLHEDRTRICENWPFDDFDEEEYL